MTEDIAVNIVGQEEYKGAKEIEKFLSNLFKGFPNLTINLISVLFSNANKKIVYEVNLQGRQIGWWRGNPASGKIFSIDGVISLEFNELRKVK